MTGELAHLFVVGRNRREVRMCVWETTVSRNTLSGSVEGSFYLLLSAGRDGNLEVTSSGCLEADEVTAPLCRQLCPGEWRLMLGGALHLVEELELSAPVWEGWGGGSCCPSRWNTAVVSASLSCMPTTQLCMVQTKNQGLGLCSPTHIH